MPAEAKKTTAALILVSREIVIAEPIPLRSAIADYHPIEEGLLERFLDLDVVGTPRTLYVTGATFGIRADEKRRTFRETYDMHVKVGHRPVDIFALLEVGEQFLGEGDENPVYGTKSYRDRRTGKDCFPYIIWQGEWRCFGFCDMEEAERWPGILVFGT